MDEISILDLQNLRHLIGGCDTNHCKMPGLRPGSDRYESETVF